MKIKKIISQITLVTLLVNIFSPILTYAAPYDFNATTFPEAVEAVAQQYVLDIPRDIVEGDELSITISGSIDKNTIGSETIIERYASGTNNPFISSTGVLADFCNKINTSSTGGLIVSCNYNDDKKYTFTAQVKGVPLEVSELTITRDPLNISTTPHIVAVAKKVSYPINPNLQIGDNIKITIGTGNVDFTYSGSFSNSTDYLLALADEITNNTSVTGSYSSASGIILEAKTPGIDFTVSNFIITSPNTYPVNIHENVEAKKQIENLNLRPLNSGETLSLTFSGTNNSGNIYTVGINGVDSIENLKNNLDALEGITAKIDTPNIITVESEIAGNPFEITNIQITGGQINTTNKVPNVEATFQEDYISIPRNLYIGDVINYEITAGGNLYSVTQGYNTEYLTGFTNLINTALGLSNYVEASIAYENTRTILLKSKIAGTAFTGGELNISTYFDSQKYQTGSSAEFQQDTLALTRDFVPGDKIRFVMDGNIIEQDFNFSHSGTLDELISKINSGSTNVTAAKTDDYNIDFIAKTAGIGYDIHGLNITNSTFPTILVEAETPTKQKNIFTIPTEVLTLLDNIGLSISGTDISGTTFDELNNNINLSSGITNVKSENNSGSFTLESLISTGAFSLSNIISTGTIFNGVTTQTATGEIKAQADISINGVPSNLDSIQIGECIINFDDGQSTDLDCSVDGIANIKPTGKDENEIVGLISSLNISDTNNGTLSKVVNGTGITFKTSGTQLSSTGIYFSGSTTITGVTNTPKIGKTQISEITLPRDFVSGDNLYFEIGTGSLTQYNQGFYVSSGASLENLRMQINNLPYVTATLSGNILIIESENNGEEFMLGNFQFINTTSSIQTITSFEGKSQESSTISIPYSLNTNDTIEMGIDGVIKSFTGCNDLSTLKSSIESNFNGFTASGSDLNSFSITGPVGQSFSLNKFEVIKNLGVTPINPNKEAVRQVSTLTIPDEIIKKIDQNGINININSGTINQKYNSDLTGTLDGLNSQINNIGFESTYINSNNEIIFTITGAIDGSEFNANISGISQSVYSNEMYSGVINVDSGTQVHTLNISSLNINTNDTLTFSLTGNSLTFNPINISGSLDQGVIYNNLASSINADISNLAINSEYTGGVLQISSKTPGISFGTGILDIINIQATSSGVQDNVVAEKQIDSITLPRPLTEFDKLEISFNSGAYIETIDFSGSQDETLSGFVVNINSTMTGILTSEYNSNTPLTITFTASIAGNGFTVDYLKLTNTPQEGTKRDFVVALPQISSITLPDFVTGDELNFSVLGLDSNSNIKSATVNLIVNSGSTDPVQEVLDMLNVANSPVTASFDNQNKILTLTGKTAGVPFNFDKSLVIINKTNPYEPVGGQFVPPVDQVTKIEAYTEPREGLTYFAQIDSVEYSYTTGSGDTIDNVINVLFDKINNGDNANNILGSTGAVASTGANTLTLTSYSSGIAFNIVSGIKDITPPRITTVSNNSEILKSGTPTTGVINISEEGKVYFVLSGALTDTINVDSNELINLSQNQKAFSIDFTSINGSDKNITIPTGIEDGKYNIVTTDAGSSDTLNNSGFTPNYSSEITGWFTVDNTAPIVVINNNSGSTVNTNTIDISGSSYLSGNIKEANLQITGFEVSDGTNTITNSLSGIYTDGNGDFTLTGVELYTGTTNEIKIYIIDDAGNIGSGTVSIIQDPVAPIIFNYFYPDYTNSTGAQVDVQTESGILAEIYDNSGSLVASGITDGSGLISFNIALELDYNDGINLNNYVLKVTDNGGNYSTGAINIVWDITTPVITNLSPQDNSRVHLNSLNVSGITKPNSNITITNSGSSFTGSSTSTGYFEISVDLNHTDLFTTTNLLNIDVFDQAGNTYNTGITIIEDSIPNSLIIGNYPNYTSSDTITLTGSYKAGTTLSFSGDGASFSNISTGATTFQVDITLNQNSTNNITITADDGVLGIQQSNIIIVHDNINPDLVINTASGQFTNNNFFSVQGTTETGSIVTINGGSGTQIANTGTGNTFDVIVELNTSTSSLVQNNLTIESMDLAGNTKTQSGFIVTYDPVYNFINITPSNAIYTNLDFVSFSGTTKPNSNIQITGGSGNINFVADGSGSFSTGIYLNSNTQNDIFISSTDNTNTTVTGTLVVIQDNIAPVINPTQTGVLSTNQASITLDGIVESGATISFTNSIYLVQAGSTGAYTITIPLLQNTTNYLTGTAQDQAGNISTPIYLTVIQDNLGPVLSGIKVNTQVNGTTLNANYSFNTNEVTNSTFYLSTTSDIFSSQIFSGSTTGLTHSGVVVGLTPNTTYYYQILSSDLLGNSTTSPVNTINFIDNIGPVISGVNVNNITTSGATLNFNYGDSHFNSGTLATGSIVLSDGTNQATYNPILTYNSFNSVSYNFNNLNESQTYNYTITLTDDFGNIGTATGGFVTSTNITLTGSDVTSTGSITLSGTSSSGSTTLSGNITIVSDPNTSNLSTGSIVINSGTTIITGTGWNNTISSPVLVDPTSTGAATNSEISGLVSSLNTATMTYSGNVIQTIFVGGNTQITSTGGLFTITVGFNTNMVGENLRIYRSQDGNSWQANSPMTTCTVSSANTCTFTTDTLGYFSFIKITGTQVIINTPIYSGGGGGGGGGASIDFCPSGDYSTSYYDGSCGIKKDGELNNTGSTNDGQLESDSIINDIKNTQDIDQKASKYILLIKKKFYETTVTQEQKIDLWKKIIKAIDKKLEDKNLNKDKSELLNKIKSKAIDAKKSIENDINNSNKTITGGSDKSEEQINIPSSDIKTDSLEKLISYKKFIDVDHVVVVRAKPSYKGEILDYLPRNMQVELIGYSPLWSKIKYYNGKVAYIRSKYLRNENRQDRGRTAGIEVFYDISLQADVDLRKVKVAKSLNVRKGPGVDNKIKTVLHNGDSVLILDEKPVNGWYEIRWTGGTGWVNGKYIDDSK